jgi:hypothetical protein
VWIRFVFYQQVDNSGRRCWRSLSLALALALSLSLSLSFDFVFLLHRGNKRFVK